MIDYGHGVMLGPVESAHLPQLQTWRNHPEIRRWCRQYDLISAADQAAWYERQRKDVSIRMYAIHAEGEMVGVCGLTSIDLINRRAEFSLYIGPEAQGRGLGRRALSTLLDHGFRAYGLNSIWGETFDGNPAARMFEALGFRKEGTRRGFYFRDGQFIDAHLYGILAAEWAAVSGARILARKEVDRGAITSLVCPDNFCWSLNAFGSVPVQAAAREEKAPSGG